MAGVLLLVQLFSFRYSKDRRSANQSTAPLPIIARLCITHSPHMLIIYTPTRLRKRPRSFLHVIPKDVRAPERICPATYTRSSTLPDSTPAFDTLSGQVFQSAEEEKEEQASHVKLCRKFDYDILVVELNPR